MAGIKHGLERGVWDLFEAIATIHSEGAHSGFLTMLQRCMELFEATGASLFLSKDVDNFELRAQCGADTHVPAGAIIRRGIGIAGTSINLQVPLLLDDLGKAHLFQDQNLPARADLVSSMVLPLVTSTTGCIGVLNLCRGKGNPPFTKVDLASVGTIGFQIALAVDNARLFADSATARAQLQAVLQHLSVGVIVVSSEGEVLDANVLAKKMCGDIVGVPLNFGQTTGDPNLWSTVQTVYRGRDRGQSPAKTVSNDLSHVWRTMASDMALGRCVITIEDITQIEHQAAESSRLKRLAEIGQMTATIAHEIRNPLSGIRGAAQMIQDAPEEVERFAPMILEEVDKLNHLCSEFLDFARPLRLIEEVVDLFGLAQRLITLHGPQFDRKEVGVTVCVPGIPCTILGDGVRLEQSLRNLLLNSLDACQPGNHVKITVLPSGWIVEDNGSGMVSDVRNRLFTPFMTTKPQGTGLGLSTVKKIIDAHGGRIQVESEVGKGSKFEVRFPVSSTQKMSSIMLREGNQN